jgi:acyl-CoA thioesterase
MMTGDHFSQWLGIKVLEINEGTCLLSMVVRKEMLNGFGIAHGGITYSLADSALAFASNSKGRQSLSIETSIAHVKRVHENDTLFAQAANVTETDKIGHYEVKVWATEKENPVALFKGIVYRTHRNWEP